MSDTAVGEAPALTSGAHQRIVDVLTRELGDAVLEHVMDRGDLWVRVENAAWHRAVELCRRPLGLQWFCFLGGMDWLPLSNNGEKTFKGEEGGDDDDAEGTDEDIEAPDDTPAEMATGVAGGTSRFQVLLRLEDVKAHVGVTLKADLDADDPRIASVADLFRGADWHEREAWEMYGFTFDGHPGLRHLYLPGDFEGHPGRKDFPLLARELKPWPGLVNVEQIPDHLDPKKIEAAAAAAAAEAEADTTATAAPGADAVPAEQAAEAEADRPVTAEAPVAQAAPEAAQDAAGEQGGEG